MSAVEMCREMRWTMDFQATVDDTGAAVASREAAIGRGEANVPNVLIRLYGYLRMRQENGVQTAFMAREVEGVTMRWVLVPLVLGCLWAGLWLPRPAAATELRHALQVAQAEDIKPLAQVLATIGQRIPGRALDAELVKQGEPTYRVKWLGEDGKVREVTSDAKSGKILDVR